MDVKSLVIVAGIWNPWWVSQSIVALGLGIGSPRGEPTSGCSMVRNLEPDGESLP